MVCDYCANKRVCTDNNLDELTKELGKECLNNSFKYFEKKEKKPRRPLREAFSLFLKLLSVL